VQLAVLAIDASEPGDAVLGRVLADLRRLDEIVVERQPLEGIERLSPALVAIIGCHRPPPPGP